jgi:hypothetical protein
MTLIRNKQLEQMAKTCDKSLVKGKDLEAFNAVIGYLRDNDLNPEIKGSVIENPLNKGMSREYGDIDILVSTSKPYDENFFNAFRGINSGKKLPNNLKLIAGESNAKYFGTTVDHKFELEYTNNAGRKTLLDVCFNK